MAIGTGIGLGGQTRVPIGGEAPWRTLAKTDPEFRAFVSNWGLRRGIVSVNLSPKDYELAYDEYIFERQFKRDLANKRLTEQRSAKYAAAGMEYNPNAGRIVSMSTQKSQPSQRSLERQAEKAAIRSKKEQEAQELKDAKWLSNYESKKAELERRSTSFGVSPQENYNAQQELIKLELERQRRETRMPGYETPAQAARRAATESETAKRTSEMERQNRVVAANQQLDRLIAALDQTTEAGAIAQINKLRPQLDKGASPESIIRQAQAAYASAEKLREKKREESMADWKIKFDYGKGKAEELQRNAQRFQVMMQNARMLESRSSINQKELGDLEKDLLNAQAELAKWEGALAVMPEVVEGKPDPLNKERGDLTRYIAGLKQTIQVIDEAISTWKPRGQTGGGMLPVPSEYSQSNPARPETQADFDALPSGSYYINPANGMVYIKN